MEYTNRKLHIVRAAILLACFLTLSIFAPVFVSAEQQGSSASNAVSVSYVERSWNAGAQEVVSTEKTRDNVQTVPADGNMTSGWYYLDRNVTKNGRVNLTGDVHLILGDGKTLDVKGLYIPYGKTLTIYGQTKNEGRLYSHPDSDGAGIGGKRDSDNGNIIIQGGNIEAYGHANCAGIGTNDSRKGGAIKIYGGTIKAQGGKKGAGIGGGKKRNGGTVEIYGGTVNATGGQDSAGIGGGEDGDGGNITIYGGIVNATGSHYAAGIGGGNDDGDGGNITINGGTVTAKGGDDAAGIGGAEDGDGGTITINGGTVNVTAGANAAGIGGGENGDGGKITITGGDVTVKSRDGAAIGGAEDGDGGTTTINGGTLWLDSGNGAGIGGGNKGGDGGKITITGGDLHIHAEHGAGIGGGRAADALTAKQSGDGGTIRISGNPTFDITADYGYGIGAGDASDKARRDSGDFIGSGGDVRISGGEFTFRGDRIQACFGGDTAHFEMTGGTVIDAERDTSHYSYLFYYLGNAEIEIRGGTLTGCQVRMKSKKDDTKFEMTGGELRIRNHYYVVDESIKARDIILGDNVMVKKGEEENAQKPVKASDREKAASGTTHYVTIVTCDHPDASYRVIDEEQHRASCTYCKTNFRKEDHTFKDGKCEKCGYAAEDLAVTFDPDNGEDPYLVSVSAGDSVERPADPIRRGYVFKGWYQVTGDTVADTPFDFEKKIMKNTTLKAQWTTQWSEIQKQIDEAEDGAVITLDNDCLAGPDDIYLLIEHKTITLDLNGHVIDRAEPASEGSERLNDCAISVYWGGNLIVKDSGGDGMITGGTFNGVIVRDGSTFTLEGGSIYGNISSYDGGGVYVEDGATFIMNGGDISSNGQIEDGSSGNGGGVYSAGTFTMNGGSIRGNFTMNQGGGVYSAGTFTMTGGDIEDNASSQAGGGVYVNNGTFAMTGGSVEGNVSRAVGGGGVYVNNGTFRSEGGTIRDNVCYADCHGGGVYVADNAGFALSGGPVVEGNQTLMSDGEESRYESDDVYLPNSSKKIRVTGKLEETAMIGVRVPDASYTGSGKPFTSGLNGKGAAENFLSNSEVYLVDVNSAGEAYLNESDKYAIVTFDRNDGSDDEEWDVTVVKGETVEKPEDPTMEGNVFLGWYQVLSTKPEQLAEEAFDFHTPITEDITLKAVWEEIEWGEPTYEWAEDNSSVTATRTAVNDPKVTQTETVDTVSKVTKEPTCEGKGETTYTAVFENPAFEPQTKTVEDIDPIGHKWGEPTYAWASDNGRVTATRFCQNDSSHEETETVDTTRNITKDPTCTEEGLADYTAAFKNAAFGTQTKTGVAVKALGHKPSKETVIKNKVEATCTEAGSFDRVTVCERCDEELSSEHVMIEALGHDYLPDPGSAKEPTCTEAGREAGQKCSRCGSVIEGAEIPALGHDWSEWTVTKPATETEEGEEKRTCSRCAETEIRAIPETDHVHHVRKVDAKGATCTATGNIEYYVCDQGAEQGSKPCGRFFVKAEDGTETIYCGDEVIKAKEIEQKDTVIAMTDHTWNEGVITKEATCTETGVKTYTCTICGVATKEEVIDMLPHEIEFVRKEFTEPTCTEYGYHWELRQCVNCKEIVEGGLIEDDPRGHDYQLDESTAKEPTCTEAGKKADQKCSRCESVIEGAAIPALGHDYKDVVTEPTCTEPGYTTHTCSRCGDSYKDGYVDALGHMPAGEFVIENVTEATCTEAGAYDRVTVCKRCGDEMARVHETTPALGHDYQEVEGSAKDPTCTEPGKKADRKCSRCESKITGVEIPALGHDWGEWTVITPATETAEGEETRTCENDHTHTETRVIPKTNHKHYVKKVAAVPATCTATGNKEYYICDQGEHPCGRFFIAVAEGTEGAVTIYENGTPISAQEVNVEDVTISLAEHSWDEGVITQEPGCTSYGVRTFTCTVCGATKEEAIDWLGHETEKVTEIIREPACEESGYHWEITQCKFCREIMHKRLVTDQPKGHDYQAVVTDPTCTEKGYTTHTCGRCGDSYVDDYVDALGHDFHEVEGTAVAPTCEKAGKEADQKCSRCGEEITGKATPALGHDWGAWTVTKEATVDEEGEEIRTCTQCGATETRAIPKIDPASIEYRSIAGDGATWTKGSSEGLAFTFKRSVEDETTFRHFKGIQVDGSDVSKAYYDAVSGSVVVTLKPEYLESLSAGEHKLAALFEDGNAPEVSFKIAEAKDDDKPDGKPDGQPDQDKQKGEEGKGKAVPGTGDENQPVIWASLLLLSALAIGIVTARRVRKNK